MPEFFRTESGKKLVTFIPGDGIGAEVTGAARRIIEADRRGIAWEDREAGASVFKKGLPSGVPQDTIDSIKKTKIALKGPLETPIGFGEKSANVTLRKLFETYANIRPVRTLPGVPTPFANKNIDLVVVRENVEDLYAGIEYMQTPGVAEAAQADLAQGLREDRAPGLRVRALRGPQEGALRDQVEHHEDDRGHAQAHVRGGGEGVSRDRGAAHHRRQLRAPAGALPRVVRSHHHDEHERGHPLGPDVGADRGLGFAPSANLGTDYAIFEAVHGSAPKYAGKNVINPTAVIFAAVMMLRRLGEFDAAGAIENSIIFTLEEGKFRTRDIVGDAGSCSTTAYTDAIIANLGKKPSKSFVRDYKPIRMPTCRPRPTSSR
jgi:isocitrate dehydrogenase